MRPDEDFRQDETAPRVLTVGDVAADQAADIAPREVIHADFADVSAAALERWAPDIVISPLVGEGFDCLDLANLLTEAGFAGRYLGAAGSLPKPAVVRREVRACYPDLDFDILGAAP
ncbi:hypothetical protein [Sinisalibacter aestuarii]|uniref:Uncharacterized protein n=1 Tax=Sinisalibacter aestuarii TaxID=2949426 RepID=A0ABQ5LRM5_9RHOB|nr:hypothetical protein [Sinisalibacter aestuarii]GKY87659.1 hypothetical protein STA1M1_15280 [Sinisalibacter aestuarii]